MRVRHLMTDWTFLLPVAAVVVLTVAWGRTVPVWAAAILTLLLAGAVLAAVHHAEVVAMRVGEPFGSLVLAVAVTVIEVALIVTLMISGGSKASSLARDTVFSAVMITCNGVVGVSLLRGSLRRRVALFNAEGTAAALTTVVTLTTLSLLLPAFTTSGPGLQFSTAQLVFAAAASLVLYLLFVGIQTVRHRDYFLPITSDGTVVDSEEHASVPSPRASFFSLVLLLVALVAVVGDAKIVSPTIERGVKAAGYPPSVVGVIIALVILMPETLAAVRAAGRDRIQTSLNLAYGSAMASIGLTIPTIAVASIWLRGPLVLGLGPTQIVLFALTAAAGILTTGPGRATALQGGVHLAILAAFLFLAFNP
ncbi:MAG TPA: ionic transporter y4hA [Mycobacterium sp.]|nr:ionic transporter y4hA [Micromonosporaceae bacterium]